MLRTRNASPTLSGTREIFSINDSQEIASLFMCSGSWVCLKKLSRLLAY
jgi:hypothetical protein